MARYWTDNPMSMALPVQHVLNILDRYISEVKEGLLEDPSEKPVFRMFWLSFSDVIHKLEPPESAMVHVEYTRYWIKNQVRHYQPYALAWIGTLIEDAPGRPLKHLLSSYVEYCDTKLAKQEEIIVRSIKKRDGSTRVCIDFVPVEPVMMSLYNGRLANILGDM